MESEPEVWAAAAKRVDPERLGALADRLLSAEGIGGVDAESREMLLAEIAKALKQAFGARQRNAEGDYRPDPMAEALPLRGVPKLALLFLAPFVSRQGVADGTR